jgi:hypothetical protein
LFVVIASVRFAFARRWASGCGQPGWGCTRGTAILAVVIFTGWKPVPLRLHGSRVILKARPFPIFCAIHQVRLHGVPMDIRHLFIVLLYRPQRAIEETPLEQHASFAASSTS